MHLLHPQQQLLERVGFHSVEEDMQVVHKHNFNSCISEASFLYRDLVFAAA